MDNINKENCYSYKEAVWHKHGTIGQDAETCESVFSRMDQVALEKREYSIVLNGASRGSGEYAIVRIEDGKEFVIGGTRGVYKIVQPLEYIQLYDRAVGKPCETLGFLGTHGEKMFITSVLPEIDIYGDPIKLYQALIVGFDGVYGAHQYVVAVRIICENTMSLGIADAEKTSNHGRGQLYVGRHNQINHLRDLEAWLGYVQTESEKSVEIIKNLFCKMQDKPLTVDEAFGLTKQVYKSPDELPAFYPDSLRNEKQVKIDDATKKAEENRDLVMDLFKGAGIGIDKTCFGLYNSVTEFENHYHPSKKDSCYSLLAGNKQNVMEEALVVIGDYAKQ